jgi:putative nucleotidyltransferase with HDIG domain
MLVKIENISPGMIVEQDIFTDDAILLIPKGSLLTEQLIAKLLEFGMFNIKIETPQIRNADFSNFNKNYTEAVGKIKNAFETVKYKKNVDVSEFENIIDGVINNSQLGLGLVSYMKLIENKDEYTLRHSINVSVTAMLMGKWLGYSDEHIKQLGVSAILHDIGKVSIPENILNKPGKLTDAEFNLMKNHTKFGYELLNNSKAVSDEVKMVALLHHEKMDGSGYPLGLRGSKISEAARIVAICDIYDAVTSKRVYKNKENPLKGLKVIFDDSYNGLDLYLCKVFLNNVSLAYSGSQVVLNNGNMGKIIKVFPENPEKPWIVIDENLFDLKISKDLNIIDVI